MRKKTLVISEAVKLKQYLLQTHCVYKGEGEVLFRLCGFGVHRSAVCQGSVIAPFSSASHVQDLDCSPSVLPLQLEFPLKTVSFSSLEVDRVFITSYHFLFVFKL